MICCPFCTCPVFKGKVGVWRILTLVSGALALSFICSLMPILSDRRIQKKLDTILAIFVPFGYVIFAIVPFKISIIWLFAYVCDCIKFESPKVTKTDSIYHMVCAVVLVLIGGIWSSILLYAYRESMGRPGLDFPGLFWIITIVITLGNAGTHLVTGILLLRVSRQPPAPAPAAVPSQSTYYFPPAPNYYYSAPAPPQASYFGQQTPYFGPQTPNFGPQTPYFGPPPPPSPSANLQNQPAQQSPEQVEQEQNQQQLTTV